MLLQCRYPHKRKQKQITGWSQIATLFDILEIVNIIKSIIFKFGDRKYLPILLHQLKTDFFTMKKCNMNKADYLDKFNNLVDMTSVLKGQLHYQYIVDIFTEGKHPGLI